MIEAPRLYVITDNPTEASLHMVAFCGGAMPSWVKVLSDPLEVRKLPNGSSAFGLFFPRELRGHPSLVETEWQERKGRGGIEYDRTVIFDKLDAWKRWRDEALAEDRKQKQGAAV